MGFSVSGSAAIIFIAAFVSVGILYTSAYNGYEQVTTAENAQADRLMEQRNTDLNVTTVTYNSSTDNLTVQVLNEGSTTLSVDGTDVLADGVLLTSPVAQNVSGSTTTDVWAPGETLNVTYNVSSKPSRVKVVSENGVSVTEVL